MAISPRRLAGLLAIACCAGFGVFLSAAAGFTHAPGSPFATPGAAGALALGDLDGDARSDAVIANSATGSLEVMLGGARGTLSPAPLPPVATGGSKPSDVAIADFNGDGKQDAVAANDGSKNVSVLLGDGAGGLVAAPASRSSRSRAPARRSTLLRCQTRAALDTTGCPTINRRFGLDPAGGIARSADGVDTRLRRLNRRSRHAASPAQPTVSTRLSRR